MYRKQALTAYPANNTIHLHNRSFRIIFQKLLKIGMVSSNTASSVHLEFWLFITRTVFDFSWQINVPDVKKPGINVIIQSLFTAHEFVNMIQINLMKRLPVFDQRADNPIDSSYVIFIGQNPSSRF